MTQEYDASKEWKGKKVVLVSVPGAFTPGCQARHLPPYIGNLEKILDKGVNLVAVMASNDGFVMSAWGKVNGVKDSERIIFLSDTKTQFAKQIGWMAGRGDRTGRWASTIADEQEFLMSKTFANRLLPCCVVIIEKDGTISYAEKEQDLREVTVRGLRVLYVRYH
jgi:alkyl hydroperoxide reductase 1